MANQPVLPGYTVTGVAGVGSSGAVWTARSATGDQVVIRILPAQRGADEAALGSRIAAVENISHPALAVLDSSLRLPSGQTALVSALVDGTTLATMSVARGGLSHDECLSLAYTLLDGLAHLHATGVVHGDVAPANVMLVVDEASMDGPEPTLRPVLVDLVTVPGQERGTPGFRAPELSAGGPASAASDVYALATMVVWSAAPTDRAAVREELVHLLERDPQRRPGAYAAAQYLHQYRAAIRPAEQQALAAATLRDHAARAPTITTSGRRHRARARHRRRHPVRLGVGALVAIAVAACVWVLAEPPSPQVPSAGAQVAQEPVPLAERLSELTRIRDQALNDQDGQLLASVTSPGSAAAAADAALLDSLTTAGEQVQGYRSSLAQVEVVRADDDQAQVTTMLTQAAHTRILADGTQHRIAAQPTRCAFFDLVRHREQWRVAQVRPCSDSSS